MELAEQFRACLLGLALAEIRAAHGRTDHTKLMTCVLEAYNVRGAFDAEDITERLVFCTQAPDLRVEAMTQLALRRLQAGWQFERAAQLAYAEASSSQRLSASPLVRVLPPGLLHYHDDLHLIGESRIVCGLTHQSEMVKLCCTALNLALQHMLLVGTGGLLDELLVWVEPRSSELAGWLQRIPRLRPDRLDVGGSAPAVLQAALWAAVFCTDYAEGVNLLAGQSSPTAALSCAVAGAMLGARFGLAALPVSWLEAAGNLTELDQAARRLYFLSQQAELPLRLLAEAEDRPPT